MFGSKDEMVGIKVYWWVNFFELGLSAASPKHKYEKGDSLSEVADYKVRELGPTNIRMA